MTDFSDRIVAVAKRVGHAVRMGLLVGVVALGSAALWFVFNAPDMGPGEDLVASLQDGPRNAGLLVSQDWTHVCFGAVQTDIRDAFSAQTPRGHLSCQGWNGGYRFYDGFASLGFTGPDGCTVIPIHRDVLTLSDGDETICEARRGFMRFTLDTSRPGPPLLVLISE